jgi:integrating conjugative element protein (TIGR03759 family)
MHWAPPAILAALLLGPLPALGDADSPLELRETRLTETDMVRRAEAWGLSFEEWQRFETLMQGQRGLWSPDLDPIMVLGIHARSDDERRRYAELTVEQERARVAGELAFQRAYDEAWRRLYPDELPIDRASLACRRTRGQASANDLGPRTIQNRILLFTETADCPACDAQIAEVLAKARALQVGLDIYLLNTGPGDEAAVRAWAGRAGDSGRRAYAQPADHTQPRPGYGRAAGHLADRAGTGGTDGRRARVRFISRTCARGLGAVALVSALRPVQPPPPSRRFLLPTWRPRRSTRSHRRSCSRSP